MPKIDGKEASQEEYCRTCWHHWHGACNVFLKDDEEECGDKLPCEPIEFLDDQLERA